MPERDRVTALSANEKRALLEQMLRNKAADAPRVTDGFTFSADYAALKARFEARGAEGVGDLFFQSCDGINNSHARLAGRDLLNFCSYNYLGLSGDARVSAAAKAAIDRYGTSVSASRLVSGERAIHKELEDAIAGFLGTGAAIVFVGGFATNENAIGHLFGPEDLIVYDSLIHASIQQGAKLSGANVLPFPHNNIEALDNILARRRGQARRVLIAVEGVYSMDGDIPDLRRLVEVKKRHKAQVLVDEAHSLGVLGATGRGVGEYHGVAAGDIDLWMGTLSKALASCGGYIAASSEVVDYLRYTAPGFVYSVGLSPPDCAAALAALELLKAEPERVDRLRQRAGLFLDLARARGLDTGPSRDSAVIPLMVGESQRAVALSRLLMEKDILALPIGYPAVPEGKARLRFFISCMHSEDEIRQAIDVIGESLEQVAD